MNTKTSASRRKFLASLGVAALAIPLANNAGFKLSMLRSKGPARSAVLRRRTFAPLLGGVRRSGVFCPPPSGVKLNAVRIPKA